jgi:hypothetical protein
MRKYRRLRAFENRVLRRIFEPLMNEVIRERRKLHNEELNDLCSSPNIVRVIKLRGIKWSGYIVRMRERRAYTGFWWGNFTERDHFRDPRVDKRIILEWIF